jgi:hypothetical protein
VWDLKSLIIIIAALTGGSVSDVGLRYLSPSDSSNISSEVKALGVKMDTYVEYHARETILKEDVVKQQLDGIKKQLDEMERLLRRNATH